MTFSTARTTDARRVIRAEAASLARLADLAGDEFEQALQLIDAAEKLVFTGIGKSGHVAQRMAATFSSVGKPSVFMHSTEALHGDLGVIQHYDVVVAISHSGNTSEVVDLVEYLREQIEDMAIIAIVGDPESKLGKLATVTIPTHCIMEADRINLVPTSSLINTAGVGDGLAIAWMQSKELGADDFKLLHPGGQLGARLGM